MANTTANDRTSWTATTPWGRAEQGSCQTTCDQVQDVQSKQQHTQNRHAPCCCGCLRGAPHSARAHSVTLASRGRGLAAAGAAERAQNAKRRRELIEGKQMKGDFGRHKTRARKLAQWEG